MITPAQFSSKFKDIEVDPTTGLPKLPENYVFHVDKDYVTHDYGARYLHHQNGAQQYKLIYTVYIYPLTDKQIKVPKSREVTNWLGMKKTHEYYELITEKTLGSYPVAESDMVIIINEPKKSMSVSDYVKSEFKKQVENGYKPQVYIPKELNEENILYHACMAFVNWEKTKKALAERKIASEKIKEIEDKFLGTYPPKGLTNND